MAEPGPTWLTEDDVVDAICVALQGRGWEVTQRLTTRQQGVDIVATRGARVVKVEAKGQTSSKEHTARHGLAFSLNQAKSHVGRALLTTLAVVATGDLGVIALPDDANHRRLVAPIRPALDSLGVVVAWVDPERVVRFEPDLP